MLKTEAAASSVCCDSSNRIPQQTQSTVHTSKPHPESRMFYQVLSGKMVFWWHFRYLVIAKLDMSVLWLPWGPCWSVWEWKIRDRWRPEFSLQSRLQTPALIQEGPGGQFGRRAKVWIHICSRMVPRFQGLLHVNPWRVHKAASRDSPGLTKALKKAEFRARYLGPCAGLIYHSGQGAIPTSPLWHVSGRQILTTYSVLT